MKYFLHCALLISGAFLFSLLAYSDDLPPGYQDQLRCEEGTFNNHPELGEICQAPAPAGIIYTIQAFSSPYGETTKPAEHCPPNAEGIAANANAGNEILISSTVMVPGTSPVCKVTYSMRPDSRFNWNGPRYFDILYTPKPPAPYCPPDETPLLTRFHPLNPDATEGFCWMPPADLPPCDCSELAGEGTLPYSSFLAKNGVYTDANPPQCVNVTDTETGQQCQCQLVAKKWLQTNAGDSTRWSPLPYDKDKPSGTYTGVACGAEEADTAPPEKEECFTLKSGIKWCFADPAEKCTLINGQEQCSSGCGYVNGDFVCYEENDPVIPDRPNEELNEIDDTITDPNKLMPDMNKGDLKEIQKGTEQRLDNVIIATTNNTNELQNIGDKIGETNSKLDGIGQQLDGQGKTLKGIENGLDDAFGDEGSPDGACEVDCTGSWYESAYPDGIIGIWQEHSEALNQTPMFEFLNQFSFQPSGTQPDMSICFNLGQFGDFGCKTLEVPAGVWAFLKLCILITAAFFSYRIIAGV